LGGFSGGRVAEASVPPSAKSVAWAGSTGTADGVQPAIAVTRAVINSVSRKVSLVMVDPTSSLPIWSFE
jgi:hypothetical protein